MFMAIGIALILAIAALLLLGATKPDAFHVERSLAIHAPAAKIFPFINDLHNWAVWSPYEKRDPAMKKTVSGAPQGKGAAYAWEGNFSAGAGRMEITDSQPPAQVNIDLHMLKPVEGHNAVVFKLLENGGVTNVTWSMDGKAAFFAKVMSTFISMDKMVGNDFEDGLANLKRVSEESANSRSAQSY